MSVSGMNFLFPVPDSGAERSPSKTPEKEKSKPPVFVLDMGEASREQGFRLNGCR